MAGSTITRKLLLISSSNVYGFKYLEQPAQYIKEFLKKNNVKTLLFIPYASNFHEDYVLKVRTSFNELHIDVNIRGINEGNNPQEEIKNADGIFIGGGNTFLLLKTLYDADLIDLIRDRVLKDGVPYMGISAGTNVATISINTTNDMPIVYPPTFQALNLVPFNINPHYMDAIPNTPHQGETREQRINEYLEQPHSHPVLGLREGSCIKVEGSVITLCGAKSARLFQKSCAPVEYKVGDELSFLITGENL